MRSLPQLRLNLLAWNKQKMGIPAHNKQKKRHTHTLTRKLRRRVLGTVGCHNNKFALPWRAPRTSESTAEAPRLADEEKCRRLLITKCIFIRVLACGTLFPLQGRGLSVPGCTGFGDFLGRLSLPAARELS